jgi:hypothetical protein
MGPHWCRAAGLQCSEKTPLDKAFCMRNEVVKID